LKLPVEFLGFIGCAALLLVQSQKRRASKERLNDQKLAGEENAPCAS